MTTPCYQYKLGGVRIECSPAIKDLGVRMDGKLDMSQPRALVAQKAIHILGCSKKRGGQQGKRADCLPLLSPHKALSAVLHPGLGPQ